VTAIGVTLRCLRGGAIGVVAFEVELLVCLDEGGTVASATTFAIVGTFNCHDIPHLENSTCKVGTEAAARGNSR